MRNILTMSLPALLLACTGPEETPVEPDPCEVSGNICTWLGVPGEAKFSADDLSLSETWTYLPQDLVFLEDGTAIYPDFNNHRVRQVSPDGIVTTISGTGTLGDGPIGGDGCFGGCDAMASAWNHPTHVAVNPDEPGKVYVAAWHNSRINIIDTETNTLTWYAGTGGRFYADSDNLEEAVLDLPSSAVFGDDGTLYFSDQANHLIRKITPDGDLVDIAGSPRFPGFEGDGGPAIEALLHGHTDQKADPGSKLAIDGELLYIADTVNGVIRAIDLQTGTIDTIAGSYTSAGSATFIDAITEESYEADSGSIIGYSGDGGPALEAVLNTPRDIAVGIEGELYIADTKNNCVRVVVDGTIDTFAGRCGEAGGYEGDEGSALDAVLNEPFGVAVDYDGNVYVADTLNHIVRRIAR